MRSQDTLAEEGYSVSPTWDPAARCCTTACAPWPRCAPRTRASSWRTSSWTTRPCPPTCRQEGFSHSAPTTRVRSLQQNQLSHQYGHLTKPPFIAVLWQPGQPSVIYPKPLTSIWSPDQTDHTIFWLLALAEPPYAQTMDGFGTEEQLAKMDALHKGAREALDKRAEA